MGKTDNVEFATGERIPILYEDRSVLVVDKPRGWMLAPSSWQKKSRNLQRALVASVRAGDFWARSRNLKYLRFVHRLDAGTTGLLLVAKSPGALGAYSALFQSRGMKKTYLAVVHGAPKESQWTCRLRLAPDRARPGRMKVDERRGKEAETQFRLLQAGAETALVEARPLTGRMHQVRLHLAAAGHPVVGDELYGHVAQEEAAARLALRAVELAYADPFTGRPVRIRAPVEEFLSEYGFGAAPQ
jgi:RluA family pseudouridine synthase